MATFLNITYTVILKARVEFNAENYPDMTLDEAIHCEKQVDNLGDFLEHIYLENQGNVETIITVDTMEE